jgi:hypothetical protein
MVPSTSISSKNIVPPPARESESMRNCATADGSHSRITNGFDNYEKNTGQRHPLQPEAVSKRALGSVPLTDDDVDNDEGLWYGKFFHIT